MELKGWTQERCAAHLGISEITIHRLLSLLEAPKEIKQLVEEKKLSPS